MIMIIFKINMLRKVLHYSKALPFAIMSINHYYCDNCYNH